MRFAGSLGCCSSGLGYTDSKQVNGVDAILVGDTYLPAGVVITAKGAPATMPTSDWTSKKGTYEVYQNGINIGYLKSGGKNGQFVGNGKLVWPTPAAAPVVKVQPPAAVAPQTQKIPVPVDVAAVTPPRVESIPVTGNTSSTPPVILTGNSNLVEVPTGNPLAPIVDDPATEVDESLANESMYSEAGMGNILIYGLLAGAAYTFFFKNNKSGKRRGKRNR